MPAVDPELAAEPDATDEQPAHTANSTDELPPPRALRRRSEAATTDQSAALQRRGGGRPPVRNPNRAIPTSRAPEKKRSPLVPVLLLLVLAVGGAVAYKKFLAAPPPAPPPKDTGLEAAKLAFQEGKNLVRKGQWKLAVAQFDEAATLAPDLEGLKGYLEAGKIEVANQDHLDTAQAALEKNEVGNAARELALVPETTQQISRRQELQSRVGKVADQRLKDARALAGDRSKAKQLKALAEDVLAARPNDRDALNFLDQANRALGWKPTGPAPVDPGDPAAPVISLWVGGDASGAFAKAEVCAATSQRCAKLKEQITTATGLFKRLESLEENDLLTAVRLDKAIGNGAQSPSGKQAGVRLAAVLTPKASSAAALKRWGPAMSLAGKILEGDPGNASAKNIVNDATTAANELFQRCYVSRQATPEDAIPLCKEVLEIMPPGSQLHEKSQRLIQGNKEE